MNVLVVLIPVSVGLGLAGLAGFLWSLRASQFDDPDGSRHRILADRFDEKPADEDCQIRSPNQR